MSNNVPQIQVTDTQPKPKISTPQFTSKTKASTDQSRLLGSDLMPPPTAIPPLGSKKVPLAPGYSHREWMNLQQKAQNGKNPSQAVIHRPETRLIGPEELALHDKKTDCWTALRGHVFDITEYIKYHPGGVDQIMKGAGVDATSMFNAIHRYVNFETVLKGKQVGIYSKLDSDSLDAISSVGAISPIRQNSVVVGSSNMVEKASCFGCKVCRHCLESDEEALYPDTEFKENDKFIYLRVNGRGLRRNRDYWTVGILNSEILLLKLVTKPPDIWVAHLKLTKRLEDDTVAVSFTNRYKNIILKLKKPQMLEWKNLGVPLPEHNVIEDSRNAVEDMHLGTIRAQEAIADHMFFLAIQLPPSAVVGTPVGFDVKVRVYGVSRRYTPVPPIFSKTWEPTKGEHYIYLVYKLYPDGLLTPKIRSLCIGDNTALRIGCSAGNFDTTWLQGADVFILLAAGSGITPYFRILEFIMDHNIALGISNVTLFYWTRRESEQVWKNEFEDLEVKRWWFHYNPVLTKPDKVWSGMRGRICPELLQPALNSDGFEEIPTNKNRIRFMTCGTDGFNTAAFETVEALGFHSTNLYTFLG